MSKQVIATITVMVFVDDNLSVAGWDKLSDAIDDAVSGGDIECAVYDTMPRPFAEFISITAVRE